MSGPIMNCVHCGGTLSLNDMTRPNCPFCGQVLPHQARAAEHAALINQVLDHQISRFHPGLAPNQIPQVGYQYGEGVKNLGEFYASQSSPLAQHFSVHTNQVHQIAHQAVKRTATMIWVSVGILVALMLLGAAAGMFFLFYS